VTSEKRSARINQIEKAIDKISKLLKRLENKNSLFGWIRFSVFLAGLLLVFIPFFFGYKSFSIISLVVFCVFFVAVSIVHNKIAGMIFRYKKWIEIKNTQIARANLDWPNIPVHKIFSSEELTPLEIDLDLTGNRSLHQLMDCTKTKEGSELLRSFLISQNVEREQIIHRQNIIKELLNLSHFREKFLLQSSLSSKDEFSAKVLLEWLTKSDRSELLKKKLSLLGTAAIVHWAFILLAFTGVVAKVYLINSFIYLSLYFLNVRSIKSSSSDAETLKDNLKKIIGMLSFIEKYRFGKNKFLFELTSALRNKDQSPTKLLNNINEVLSVLSLQGNPVVWFMLVLLFPIDYYLAYRIEISKKQIAENLPAWLKVWHELETYVSMANFAYINPDYTFPIIEEDEKGSGEFQIHAVGIGHPLIQFERNIKNDFEIIKPGTIGLITGSNMSGKSTFLRTIGINTCLAYAGAPVNASHFSTGVGRIFTCIKVSDSVIDGISYFYAEVKRLKALLAEIDLDDQKPILFLIDEIFKGTNNIERNQGSRAILKALAHKNGIGLVSTHDLELVKLSDEITSITNYHFREDIDGQRMVFDYKIRTGPCPTTNALKIMKLNGLPIE
jgi:DNA mismatch repair ATPase MutS